jgi:hypothetical protein
MQQLLQPSYRQQHTKLLQQRMPALLQPLLTLRLLQQLLLRWCQAQQQAWQAGLRAASCCPAGCWWAGLASCMPLHWWLSTSSASPQPTALPTLLLLTSSIQYRHKLLLRQSAAAILLRLCFNYGSSLQQQWQ